MVLEWDVQQAHKNLMVRFLFAIKFIFVVVEKQHNMLTELERAQLP